MRHYHGFGVVCGNYGILTEKTTAPHYRAINFDITLHTRRAITVAFPDFDQWHWDADRQGRERVAVRLTRTTAQGVRNIRQLELGLAMRGEEFSVSYDLLPAEGGLLAQALAHAHDDGLAREYAGYLPAGIADCSASGPVLDGAPGVARTIITAATALLKAFLPLAQGEQYASCLAALMAQCSQGRALGLLAAKAGAAGEPTLVAVYHVRSAGEAKDAVHAFVQQAQQVRASFMGGALAHTFSLAMKPAAETLAGTPVDLFTLAFTSGTAAESGQVGIETGEGAPPCPLR